MRTDNGWLEAAIAWEVCASIHAAYAKGRDALFTTRHADFVRHANDARAAALEKPALLVWAVERWRAEVEHRPLVNIHRRSLDDAWRQVVRFAGGDPDALLGPRHDARVTKAPSKMGMEDVLAMEDTDDGEGGACNVCGRDVRYGERHHKCGDAVMKAVSAALAEANACQYAKDVGMPEYRCVKKCQYSDRPIDMVLFCPACGGQHIDAPMTDVEYSEHLHESSWWELGGDKPERWTNPPHRSHLCRFCKHVWRPADVPTNGVKEIQTKGKNDSPGPPFVLDRS